MIDCQMKRGHREVTDCEPPMYPLHFYLAHVQAAVILTFSVTHARAANTQPLFLLVWRGWRVGLKSESCFATFSETET